jgi:hypothetical protein
MAQTRSLRVGAASPAAAVSVYGVGGDEVFVDGVVEHHREHGDDAGHGGGWVAFAEGLGPGGYGECGDLAQGGGAPAGEDVVA